MQFPRPRPRVNTEAYLRPALPFVSAALITALVMLVNPPPALAGGGFREKRQTLGAEVQGRDATATPPCVLKFGEESGGRAACAPSSQRASKKMMLYK